MRFRGKLGTHAGSVFYTSRRKLPKVGDMIRIKEIDVTRKTMNHLKWHTARVDRIDMHGDQPFIFMSRM